MTRRTRFSLLLAIVLLAAALRGCAVIRLPVDFDEPVYFSAGQRLAAAVREGDFDQFVNADAAPEHPALVKLLYAAVFLGFPPAPEVPDYPVDLSPPRYAPYAAQIGAMGSAARLSSAFFGVLNVLLVALVSPAAGALLAIHTYTIKYTSQIYLEALPMFTATVAVLAYCRAVGEQERKEEREQGRKGEDFFTPAPFLPFTRSPLFWWALSAVALGLTAAGKYLYAVAGIAIAADALWRWGVERLGKREKGSRGDRETVRSPVHPFTPSPLLLLAWGGVALLVFFAANPNLWPDPVGRLAASLGFHAAYTQGPQVAQSGYPWYQPFVWLFTPQPVVWHPTVLFTPLDGLTAALGVLGAGPLWRSAGGRRRVVVLWWAIGLVFLLLWPTKWPQYSLIMTVPVCLCAAEGLRQVASWARRATGGE